jgi:nucleoside 2-deoxyribosyltransferase
MRLYLAANLFTPFDRKRNSQIAEHLTEHGHEVFLPQNLRTTQGKRPSPSEIFEGCVRGVHECDLLVGLVDGPDVDSGTAWELGYAYARGKPIVALRTDYRGAEHGPVNIMIEFSSDVLVRSADPLGSDSTAVESLLHAVETVGARSHMSEPQTQNAVCRSSHDV